MAEYDDAVAALTELIQTCRDGEQGFHAAAESIQNVELKRLFTTYANQRREFASELSAEVRRLGGEPETHGSVAGGLHRGWMSLKAAISGRDDDAIVAACETGEDSAKSTYEQALNAPLPTELRRLVERQYARVREAHDRVRDLKRAA